MSYIFYWPVGKPFKETEEVLEWSKKHCPSYITNDAVFRSDEYGDWYYRFYFGDERDYILCQLRWS